MTLVLLLAPLLTGLVRKVKARLQRRRGPSLLQPYRDLRRLLRQGGGAGGQRLLAVPRRALFRSSPPPGSPPRWSRPSPPA